VTTFVTPYGRSGASSRVRVFEWLDRIDGDHEIVSYVSHRNASPRYLATHPASVLQAERRLRRLARRPVGGSVFLHREASPLSRGGLEQRILEAASRSIYDFDDALQWDTGEGALHRRLAPKSAKALAAVGAADRVIAGNTALADWASAFNDDVVVIPSCVAPERYRVRSEYAIADPPRLGWIGSPNNEPYLSLIAEALRSVHRRTGARLTIIGTTPPQLGALESMIDRIPWSEAAQHEQLASFDIGVFPVPDERYSYGKSGYKLLQYAAAGVPCVATPIGVNAEMIDSMGLPAASTSDDWTESILHLLGLPEADRAALGKRARSVVIANYSFDAWLPRWKRTVGIA